MNAMRTRITALRFPTPQRASALYLLVILLVVFSLWIPDLFLTATTFRLVGADQAVIAILAIALLIPLVTGAFDLSVGAMLAFSLVIVTRLQESTDISAPVACVIALLACATVGAFSGLLVVRYQVNSFIATLGVSQALAAGSLLLSNNRQISGALSASFLELGQGSWFGVPVVVYYLVVVAVVAWYVLEATPLGRNLYATGSNPEAARLSGIRTDRLVWGSLIASAIVAGLAGIIYGARIGVYSNSFGPPLLFPAFAAVFFGATQFKARPNVWGTVLAVYVLAFGVKGLQLAFVSGVYWLTPMFNGVALIAAVTLASRRVAAVQRRRRLPERATEPSDVSVSESSKEPPRVDDEIGTRA